MPGVFTQTTGIDDDGFAQTAFDPAVADLGPGYPDPALLPTRLLARGLAEAVQHYGNRVFVYGANSGARAVRQAIAQYSNGDRCAALSSDSVLVTAGASHAIDLVCTRFSRPGDVVLVQRASYYLALELFAGRGLVAVPVGQDQCVPTASELEHVVLSLRRAGRTVAFGYLVPTFHNPTGRTFSIAERRALVSTAKSLGLLLVEDDPYRDLYFYAPPPPTLFALSDGGGVLAVRTLSKVLAPGLRVGWLLGAPEVVGELAQDALFGSGGGIAHLTSASVLRVLASGEVEGHVANMRREYRHRRDALLTGLAPAKSAGASWQVPAGGFFAWVRLPSTVAAADLEHVAARGGVRFWPGFKSFAVAPRDAAAFIRLAFSLYGEQRLRRAGAALAQAIHECAATAPQPVSSPHPAGTSGEVPGRPGSAPG
jgi:2-aminoadipate transaminase